MTAREIYGILVGEIGIDRNLALYDLMLWEIKEIIRGYRRRDRTLCDMLRWQTYTLLLGYTNVRDNGINSPEKLLKFPWDREREKIKPYTEEETQSLLDILSNPFV